MSQLTYLRFTKALLMAASLTAIGCDSDVTSPTTARRYQVTIENLTSGQPFSPGVIVTHNSDATLFRDGEPASLGIIAIAENGDSSVALASLPGGPGVSRVVAIDAPTMRVGSGGQTMLTFTIEADGSSDLISAAVMLICTNDGFTGFDSVALPTGSDPVVFMTSAYDAGSELNDERFTSIVDPCGGIGPVAAEGDGNANALADDGGIVQRHPNVVGRNDLDPALHGWEAGAVAQITITRL